ncbi:glutaredoxin [Desulfoprunum benzoelyticum]|uniref:ferredoxin:thioredoxin reductase n=1 Tax=Desulfoprunum benzoelyticum TaxID=1506996 RepID=A0A840UYZ9_9BACT|nr:ferredoxin-thioredoxin reductase catalytic domain-containing protein [Desulfoprunum benzoelyticum]MBB5348674.1 ferredoxin-thioredoxin reductase catalytic subunit/glutaredoxin [Desulfoprunum benzoelyticum]MBM9530047.1 glutaredoxin [Desulfoprunum benzoelyticum]
MQTKRIKLYSITTCAFCQAIKKMLTDLNVAHESVDADLLFGEEREALVSELRRINPSCSFPTIDIDGRIITGMKVQEIKETIGIRTKVDDLYDGLKKSQEAKGYFFNQDKERTFELLRGLLTNKDRYGYMSCPCRLAAGQREMDRDIICPCVYREPDVDEFGSCYCQLYVSRDWNDRKIPHVIVPERRPPQN